MLRGTKKTKRSSGGLLPYLYTVLIVLTFGQKGIVQINSTFIVIMIRFILLGSFSLTLVQGAFVAPTAHGSRTRTKLAPPKPTALWGLIRQPPPDDEDTSGVHGTRDWPNPWPSPVSEPNVDVGPPETPGLPKGSGWPSPIQEPRVVQGPPDVPGIPDGAQGLPPFIQEPNVP